jgi:hypothetical protein
VSVASERSPNERQRDRHLYGSFTNDSEQTVEVVRYAGRRGFTEGFRYEWANGTKWRSVLVEEVAEALANGKDAIWLDDVPGGRHLDNLINDLINNQYGDYQRRVQ